MHLRLVAGGATGTGGETAEAPPAAGRAGVRPLGQILLATRAVDPGDLVRAVAIRGRTEARLGDILMAHGWVSEPALMHALSVQWGAAVIDLARDPPDPGLTGLAGLDACLCTASVPWRRIGGATVVATARPEAFEAACAALPAGLGPFVMALAPERAIEAALAAGQRAALVRRAEARTPLGLSCRARDPRRLARRGAAVAAAAAACAAFAPGVLLAALTVWAVVTLVAATALKAAALWAVARRAPPGAPVLRFPGPAARLPAISVLVPLYGEAGIVPRLVARLSRLDYPRELTDVILVAEESDSVTRAALSATPLPGWMRVIVVPEGRVRTKPRALNYALDFARGSIVGVWDAEDAPDAGQLHAVARAFGEAPPDVVCLQGALDFYNARTNWLSRCFAIEYAGWFRVILPGLVRMGLVIPLGGTTLFFRRAALEELGGWDAHNVTEDADLGLRLARRGWRAGVLDSVTGEEPNARAWPWIRQRSRWLKGYAMTWGVHMRDPVRLWRDLGARRFIAVQILFAATLSQYLLAPFLWAWWGLTLGGAAPAAGQVTQGAMIALTALFVAAEGVNLAVGALGVRRAGHAGLMRWVPTLMFYFPLGAAAAFKALWEVAARPFWWDKTDHGVFDGGMDASGIEGGGIEGGGAGPAAAEDGPPRLAQDGRRAPETPRAVRPARPPFSRRPAPRGAWPPHRA